MFTMKPLYDLKKLRELCDNDQELIEASIKFFYDETINNLSLMMSKLEERDFEEIRVIAHKVKVNFVFLSCDVCVGLCKNIKNATSDDEVEELVNILRIEYLNVFEQLKKEFSHILNHQDVGEMLN